MECATFAGGIGQEGGNCTFECWFQGTRSSVSQWPVVWAVEQNRIVSNCIRIVSEQNHKLVQDFFFFLIFGAVFVFVAICFPRLEAHLESRLTCSCFFFFSFFGDMKIGVAGTFAVCTLH